MHTYSINSNERIYVAGILGILSAIIILLCKKYLPDWAPVPSVLALFSGLLFLFNKFIWKWPWFNELALQTPILNGNWKMSMRSSLDNYAAEYVGTLTISQTWTEIHLYLDGEKFEGESTMAGIKVQTKEAFTLKWEYLAQRKPQFAANEFMHHGMTRVLFKKGEESFHGNYYADQSRHTFGPVTLEKL